MWTQQGKETVGGVERVVLTSHSLPCVKLRAIGELLYRSGRSALSCDDLEGWDGVEREGI